MRVLHLFSNAKWTGPAEPALNLCVALRERGIDADFACAPDAGESINKVVETARDRGIEPILGLHLRKHRQLFKNLADVRRLRALLAAAHYDIVHCHLDNDHEIARLAMRKLATPIVRTSYQGEGFRNDWRHRRLLEGTRFLIEPSQRACAHDAARFQIPESRIAVVPGAVDTNRFDPARPTPDGRKRLNLPPDAFVLGIVARMQTHRRYEDLFEAFRLLLQNAPNAHLVVVGRGTRQEQVGFEPVRRLGLADRVHFTGYLDGEDYVGMLRAFDAGVFLVPGSDGTCRAARELLAMSKPVVAADRGMLGEIVTDGHNGLLVSGSCGSLHDAFRRLADDRPFRHQLGQNARRSAVTGYSLAAQSAAIEAIYRQVLN